MGEENPIVYIVDDDPSVQTLLRKLIQSVGLPVETFSSAQEFHRRSAHAGPSCLILDVRLPGQSGLEFQEQLARSGVAIPVIFLTGYGSVSQSVRAMKAGAVDFLEKPFDSQVLLDAVNRALEQDRGMRARASEVREIEKRIATLTPREYEVFVGIAAGLANKQVASELGMSEQTVKIHRGRVMQKLKAATFADLVRMAERKKLTVPGRD